MIADIVRSVLGPGTGTRKPKGITTPEKREWSSRIWYHLRRGSNGLRVSVTGRMYHEDEHGTLRRVPAKLRGKAAVKRHKRQRRELRARQAQA